MSSEPPRVGALGAVLIVEDDEEVGARLVEMVQALGSHAVHWASSIRAARQLVCPPLELVLLDVVLGDGLAFELVGVIREQAPGALIVAMSKQAERAQVAALVRMGAHAYLEKPFTQDALKETLASLDLHALAEPRVVDLARKEGVPATQRFVRESSLKAELASTGGNVTEAAKRLGITRVHAHRILKKGRDEPES